MTSSVSPDPYYDKLLASWRILADKADHAFARAQAEHGDLMQCQLACTGCCQQDLTVLPLEAAVVAEQVDKLAPRDRQATIRRSRETGPPCVFLDDGRCVIYEGRPLVCRTHGLPILQQDPASLQQNRDGLEQGPDAPPQGASVSVCSLNFTTGVPKGVLLDGNRVIEALTVADALFRKCHGEIDPVRIGLRDIARNGRSALTQDEGLADETIEL